ncbi:DMT family transporter [Nitrosomonas sp.]|uniref:DMT family transporter n=1 Tax=Nitrosomonas sp. TaxID=42353 RepID=UPI0033065AFD
MAINIAAVIFGTAALYGKLDISPFWIVAMRAGFGALALALVGGFTASLRAIPVHSWKILGLSGLLLGAHWLTFFTSVQLAGVAVATLTFATFPLFTIIVEATQRRRLPRPAELIVGVVIIIAVALLVEPSDGERNVGGAVAGLVSALTYALFWRVSQRLGQPLSPATISLCQNGIVFALLVPALFFSVPPPVHLVEWLSLMALGVFNTAVMLLLYLYALKRISANTCSGFVALEPVYAIALAALLFNEPVTPWIIVSLILIIGASLTLLRIEKQPLPPAV